MLANPDRLEQVVTNYLTNALTSSAVDRPIECASRWRNSWLASRSGTGNPGFLLLTRGASGNRSTACGVQVSKIGSRWVGVGLYLCRTIIERHYGQVGVQSAPGDGRRSGLRFPSLARMLLLHAAADTKAGIIMGKRFFWGLIPHSLPQHNDVHSVGESLVPCSPQLRLVLLTVIPVPYNAAPTLGKLSMAPRPLPATMEQRPRPSEPSEGHESWCNSTASR